MAGMREFASRGSRARALSPAAKVLYTAFCALSMLGIVTSMILYDDVVQFGARATPRELLENVVQHYRPSGASQSRTDITQDSLDRSARRRLLEVTHAHLFSVPVLLLVMGHLFLLTNVAARTKLSCIGLAVAGAVLHLAAPWGVHYGGAALAWLYPITGAILLYSFGVLLVVPVWDMWRSSSRDDTADP
jgi:hypothetical protein